MYCPFREKILQTTFAEHEKLLSIYDFIRYLPSSANDSSKCDEWSPNDV